MSDIRSKRIYRVTLLGGVVNALLLVAKFMAGIMGHSAAMVADAVHSLSDFVTDVIVLIFVRLSNKPADEDHAYGHGKYETIATSIIGVALLVVAIMLGWGGLTKIYAFACGEQLQSPGVIALVAAIVSIASKEWVFRITRKVADEVQSSALEANAWHHRSDAMSSIGTAIGIGGAVLVYAPLKGGSQLHGVNFRHLLFAYVLRYCAADESYVAGRSCLSALYLLRNRKAHKRGQKALVHYPSCADVYG